MISILSFVKKSQSTNIETGNKKTTLIIEYRINLRMKLYSWDNINVSRYFSVQNESKSSIENRPQAKTTVYVWILPFNVFVFI